jgi:hypothetical protein
VRDVFTTQSPFASKEERSVSEALMSQTAPRDMLRTFPTRVPLFRPRFGYPTEALTILDVLAEERMQPYNTNYTGGAWDINASARNSGTGWI